MYEKIKELLIEAATLSPQARKYKTLMRTVGRNTGFGKVTTNYAKSKIKQNPKRTQERAWNAFINQPR